LEKTTEVLLVSISKQRIYHQYQDGTVKTYVISTSLNAPSCRENSLGTPWGLHRVCDVIGIDQPKGMTFTARKPTGLCYWEYSFPESEKNLITSRILRLEGLEAGVNKGEGIDTLERFVYVHGTNHEDRLGRPASSGCIQLSNEDMIELSQTGLTGSHLYISLTN